MHPGLVEHALDCPCCGESITMLVDLSGDGMQDYIEDCEVCCRPIRLRIEVEDGELAGFACERTN